MIAVLILGRVYTVIILALFRYRIVETPLFGYHFSNIYPWTDDDHLTCSNLAARALDLRRIRMRTALKTVI
jgi:hypothetical protein